MSGAVRSLLAMLLGAALLAGCAGDIPYETLKARYASPASAWAELPGGVIVHYRDEGPRDASAIVLVHGFAASLHAWEPWSSRLSADHRLVSLDLPGHGLTRSPEDYKASLAASVAVVDQLAARLALERFVIVGNSMGGAVAWRYALAHPDKVRGLVLVNAAGWPEGARAEGPPLVFRLLQNPAGRAVLRRIDPGLVARRGLVQAYGDPALVTPELLARYVDLARAPGHRAILTRPRREASDVTPQSFQAIAAPTLVMVGARDELIPPSRSRAFAGAIPNARLIVYEAGGHVPMEQLPDRSAADLRAFVAGLP